MYVYFWAFSSVPLILVSAFRPVLYCFDYYSFVIKFKIRACDASSFVLLSQECLLWFHTNVMITCSIPVKNAIGILIGTALNLFIALSSMDILTILILSIHDQGISFQLFVSSLISFISVL